MKRFFVALCLAAVACSSSPAPTTPTAIPAAAFAVDTVVFAFSEAVLSLTAPGATAQVTALALAPTGLMRDVTATCTNWQSDNTSVLLVSSTGVLTALSTRGAASITAVCQGIAVGGLITVNPPPAVLPPVPPPPPSLCPTPPYVFDSRPQVRRCRAPNGQFAPTVCCGQASP